jgi:hypothetical protein
MEANKGREKAGLEFSLAASNCKVAEGPGAKKKKKTTVELWDLKE